MKVDIWIVRLKPALIDRSEFCFRAGVVVAGWPSIDGYEDVVVANSLSNNVTHLRGSGTGLVRVREILTGVSPR